MGEPLVMGAVAEAVGLRWAYALVAATAVAMALAARRILGPAATTRPAPETLAHPM
jgi:hypothetical protein